MTTIIEQDDSADEDLDSLLTDSINIAAARKAVKRAPAGKADPALVAIAEAAEAALRWNPEAAIARFVDVQCSCGAHSRRFDGWFILSLHRTDLTARRFARAEDHNDLPSWHYVAQETVAYCAECVSAEDLPLATPDYLIGLSALGEPANALEGQLDIIFEPQTTLIESAEELEAYFNEQGVPE